MRTGRRSLLMILALFAQADPCICQEARYFRIVGPAVTRINRFSNDGSIVWSNAQPGATYTVQTAPQTTSAAAALNWVDYVKIPTTTSVNTNQIVVFHLPAGTVFIPAGSFTMGDNLDGDTDAIPTDVYASAFYMDQNPVTFGQWLSVYTWATNHGYRFDNRGSAKGTNYPVDIVNWYDLVKWSNARSQLAGLNPVYYLDAGQTLLYTNGQIDAVYPNWRANGYRLPTEAEWEKAARGGLSGRRFPSGDTIDESKANYFSDWSVGAPVYAYDKSTTRGYNPAFASGSLPYTSTPGYFPSNGYGLNDMAGNVFQRCWDWYGAPYGQPTSDDPTGPESGADRVLRGGSWDTGANTARCAARSTLNARPSVGSYDAGFRCVRSF
jgi:formylglycine-generating enzyme